MDFERFMTATIEGMTREINERYPEIALMWLSALYMNPGKREFHAIRGTILHMLEDYLLAVECYDKALQVPPSSQQYEFNLDMLKAIQECRALALQEKPLV